MTSMPTTPAPGSFQGVGPHVVTRQLTESIAYPAHDPRVASVEYKRVHRHLVVELDEACWICGIRHSTGGAMETHHFALEWALANAADPAKILAAFPTMGEATEPALRKWLDSEGNLFVLCSLHHRGGLRGIHSITYPAWTAQKYLWDGWDLVTGKPKPMIPNPPPTKPPRNQPTGGCDTHQTTGRCGCPDWHEWASPEPKP